MSSAWVLIVLFMPGNSSGGAAIHSVDFYSEAACQKAADLVISQRPYETRATCHKR